MSHSFSNLDRVLAELQNARDFAERAARDLRAQELQIAGSRAALLAAVRVAKTKAQSRSSDLVQLEEAVMRIVSPHWLSISASLRDCVRTVDLLKPILENYSLSGLFAENLMFEDHVYDFFECFSALRPLTLSAAKSDERCIECLSAAQDTVARMKS